MCEVSIKVNFSMSPDKSRVVSFIIDEPVSHYGGDTDKFEVNDFDLNSR